MPVAIEGLHLIECEICGKQFHADDPDAELCHGCMSKVHYVRHGEFVMRERGDGGDRRSHAPHRA